jgi:NO-binding membrane sensor protein with MHYT domain
VAAAAGFAIALTVSVRTLAAFALTVGAGWLGGAIAAHYRTTQNRGDATTR